MKVFRGINFSIRQIYYLMERNVESMRDKYQLRKLILELSTFLCRMQEEEPFFYYREALLSDLAVKNMSFSFTPSFRG